VRNPSLLAVFALLVACGEAEKSETNEVRSAPALAATAAHDFDWAVRLLPDGIVQRETATGAVRGRIDGRALAAHLGPFGALLDVPADASFEARMDGARLHATLAWNADGDATDVSDLVACLTRDYAVTLAADVDLGALSVPSLSRGALLAFDLTDRGVAGVVVARAHDAEAARAAIAEALDRDPRVSVTRTPAGVILVARAAGVERLLGPDGTARVRLLAGDGLVAAVVNGDDGVVARTRERLRERAAADAPRFLLVRADLELVLAALRDALPGLALPAPLAGAHPPSLVIVGTSEGAARRLEIAFDSRVVLRFRAVRERREAETALRALHRDVRFAVTSGAAAGVAEAFAAAEKPNDPWGRAYEFARIRGGEFRVWSRGPDGVAGTEDDVTYPAAPEPLGDVAPDAGRRWLERYLAAWRAGATDEMWRMHSAAAQEERDRAAGSRPLAAPPDWVYEREQLEGDAIVVTVATGAELSTRLVLVREHGALVLAHVPD